MCRFLVKFVFMIGIVLILGVGWRLIPLDTQKPSSLAHDPVSKPLIEQTDDLKWAGNLSMNGYSLDSFKNFAKEWHLVTVRYRIDSGEFRFVYANPIAWDSMSRHPDHYSDGSVFAKVAYLLSHDSSFPSSLIPSRVSRYQLMVKDSKKHQETGGWGFALFNKHGRTLSGNPHAVAISCMACHQIVAEKDAIFSIPLQKEISFFEDEHVAKLQKNLGTPGLLKFEKIAVSALPKSLSSRLPSGTEVVQSIVGPLKDKLFQGTLDEIRPFLAIEAFKSKTPAILMSSDKAKFSALFMNPNSQGGCENQVNQGTSMIFVMTAEPTELFTHATPYALLPKDDAGVVSQSACFSIE